MKAILNSLVKIESDNNVQTWKWKFFYLQFLNEVNTIAFIFSYKKSFIINWQHLLSHLKSWTKITDPDLSWSTDFRLKIRQCCSSYWIWRDWCANMQICKYWNMQICQYQTLLLFTDMQISDSDVPHIESGKTDVQIKILSFNNLSRQILWSLSRSSCSQCD